MFIGHLADAELLRAAFPGTPSWVSLVGMGFPDLLWGVTVLTGVEKARMGSSPLQKDIEFTSYPFSHSLILTNILALLPGAAIGLVLGWQATLVFVLASISHWLLDVIVHKRDLPVLGFGRDIKVGFGLWRLSRTSFCFEYAVVVVSTLLFVDRSAQWLVLAIALLLHLVNINSFFGLTNSNPIRSEKVYATMALAGFTVMALAFSWII